MLRFASSNQIMGVRKTTDFSKKTWIFSRHNSHIEYCLRKIDNLAINVPNRGRYSQPAPLNPATAPDVTVPIPAQTPTQPADDQPANRQ
jgi:preprotein translocase subunit SecG